MRQLQTPVFEVDLICFKQKRLNLTHDPKTSNTIKPRGSFNTFGKALIKLREQFLREQLPSK